MIPDNATLLHRVDPDTQQGVFVSTSPAKLRDATFLDGREHFWTRECRAVIPRAAEGSTVRNKRYIFHTSFCGSTLLARLLDDPGNVLVLKEPQALVDASEAMRATVEHPSWRAMLHNIEAALLSGSTTETLVVKPSNWINNLVGMLCDPDERNLAIFVSIDRYHFMRAVLRGGRDRMAYTARAAAHLCISEEDQAALVEAIKSTDEPLAQIARMAGLVHILQERTFHSAMNSNAWDEEHWFTLSQLQDNPQECALRAARCLQLDLNDRRLIQRIEASSQRHSKDQQLFFSAEHRATNDQEVDRIHGATLREADRWCHAFIGS
ncbi:hypothetical protein [Novosphingopyxis sp. YJ-S2-01]|uniref:hypothetical protein n=1 Tax=Novosphingopyxis sp. YJ-S2-01 TaxID=2794021 RepID=UPI0018DC1965|nr:hypothetical protein [Novosphingopyxis sp. YJ-S2-01]MBH9537222.1 hypothetical protein [Novosphingopyxis sp. YJ-S2-01]